MRLRESVAAIAFAVVLLVVGGYLAFTAFTGVDARGTIVSLSECGVARNATCQAQVLLEDGRTVTATVHRLADVGETLGVTVDPDTGQATGARSRGRTFLLAGLCLAGAVGMAFMARRSRRKERGALTPPPFAA